jgi:4-amino-4-deoxy-L-arabinose transferase-like glycosyltransferase
VSASASTAGARQESSRADAAWLAGIVALALALRLAGAWFQSLHLDDFHTLFHARAAGLAEFFQRVRQDNHPPLFLGLVKAVRALFGEQEFALRMPAVLCGVLTVPLVWRIGRRLEQRGARAAAALLVACSSLNLELSVDLRMYSLLTLALTGCLDAALDLLEGRRGLARAASWAVIGLHTHYHFVHALAVMAGACLVVAVLRPEARAGVRRLALAGLAAGVLAFPWYAWGFPAQLAHGLAPGGSAVSLPRLLEGVVHLVYLNVSLGGELLRPAFLLAAGLVVGLAAGAALRGVSRVRTAPDGGVGFVLVATAFLLPAWSALASWITPRAGFEWRYIAGAVAPLALLAARGAVESGPLPRARAAALAYAVLAALALVLLNVRDPGREDNRAAVRAILGRARPGDAVVAAEWQPRIFPHAGAWDFYAPRFVLPGARIPPRIEHTDDFAFPPGTDLAAFPRIFVLARSLPNHSPLLTSLRQGFPHERRESYGMSIWLHTFAREPE